MSCPFAQRTQPISDKITVTGSVGSISFSAMALASARSTNGERRGLAYVLASCWISFFNSVFKRRSEPKISSKDDRSFSNSACSACNWCSSSFAKWRKRKFKMASACASLKLKRAINSAFGSSSWRMISMTSSIFKKAIIKPCKICRRASTLSKRYCKRRVTVVRRKVSHSVRISNKFFTAGL